MTEKHIWNKSLTRMLAKSSETVGHCWWGKGDEVFRKNLASFDAGHLIPLPRELGSVNYGKVLLLTKPG